MEEKYGEWDQGEPIRWLNDEDINFVKGGEYSQIGGRAFKPPEGWHDGI